MSHFDALTPVELDSFDDLEQKIRNLLKKQYTNHSEKELLLFYEEFKKIPKHLNYADTALVANIHNLEELHTVLEHLGQIFFLLTSTLYLLNDKITARDCLDIAYRQLKRNINESRTNGDN